jgi:hypothetical protein
MLFSLELTRDRVVNGQALTPKPLRIARFVADGHGNAN